jgi:hypothetical protein
MCLLTNKYSPPPKKKTEGQFMLEYFFNPRLLMESEQPLAPSWNTARPVRRSFHILFLRCRRNVTLY